MVEVWFPCDPFPKWIQMIQKADFQSNKAPGRTRVNKQSYISTIVFKKCSTILFKNKKSLKARATNQFAFAHKVIGSALACSLDIHKGS